MICFDSSSNRSFWYVGLFESCEFSLSVDASSLHYSGHLVNRMKILQISVELTWCPKDYDLGNRRRNEQTVMRMYFGPFGAIDQCEKLMSTQASIMNLPFTLLCSVLSLSKAGRPDADSIWSRTLEALKSVYISQSYIINEFGQYFPKALLSKDTSRTHCLLGPNFLPHYV